MKRGIASVIVAMMTGSLIVACEHETAPPIVLSDLRILAPLPGSPAGVVYLTIRNNGSVPITINAIRSPQFAQVEIHQTLIDDNGVSRMHKLDTVDVAASDAIRFAEGGKHLMLMNARPDARVGSAVTLEIEHTNGLLIASSTLQNRVAPD